jgi:tRNA-2-methylthio-N6-dimethylallyladenosine synthase
VEILESLEVFPSTLPTRRESAYAGWVSISVGCNNTCTFCIVPHLRGKERDRRPGEILAEVDALVQQGAIEVTLLGQNVNSYGVEFGDRQAFAKLLRAAGAVDGLERLRFTSPHPAAFTDDVIEAMAATPTVMPQLHMPLQSGSDRVLRAMRRSYRSERFLGILDRVRAAMPDAAITTDIIVGFPGETEDDFAETLRVVEASRFASAFTFQYSPRPGTPAADLPDQLPKAVVQERYERLVALQERISTEENAAQVGRTIEVLVAEGEGRRTARRGASRAARPTTGSCTSRCRRRRRPRARRVPATSSPSRSRTARRTTWWRTRLWRTARSRCAARGRATRGSAGSPARTSTATAAGTPAARLPGRRVRWCSACRRSAYPPADVDARAPPSRRRRGPRRG